MRHQEIPKRDAISAISRHDVPAPEPDARGVERISRAENREQISEAVESTYPHYDVRQGARTYASIGGVLAGFSFAAVVLLARFAADCEANTGGSLCIDHAAKLRDTAAAAFLIAFFGCVSGAFVWAITGAEELLSKRAHSMACAGCTGFVLGIGHAFWGLALLASLFLKEGSAVLVANLMVIGVALTAPALVAFPALHIKSAFAPLPPRRQDGVSTTDRDSVHRKPRVSPGDWCRALVPGYVIVACGMGLLVFEGSQLDDVLKHSSSLFDIFGSAVFDWIFGIAWALSVLGVVGTLVIGAMSLKFSVTPRWAGLWAAFHAALLWSLVLLLPSFP